MKSLKGIHHVCIKAPSLERMEQAVEFYTRVFGMPVIRRWGQGEKSACMVDTGAGILEIMADGSGGAPGPIPHVALAVTGVDEWIELVRKEGRPITMEPQDKTLPSQPPFPVRIAFFQGYAGELVELMEEKE